MPPWSFANVIWFIDSDISHLQKGESTAVPASANAAGERLRNCGLCAMLVITIAEGLKKGVRDSGTLGT